MHVDILPVSSSQIAELRSRFLAEKTFQFIYDKCHTYGWADCYLYKVDGEEAGYGANWAGKTPNVRDTMFEFFLCETYRTSANLIFERHCTAVNTVFIECQTNDSLLPQLLFEHAKKVAADRILFEDDHHTALVLSGPTMERVTSEHSSDVAYVLRLENQIIGRGGLMLNYNFPYADIYYEIDEAHRMKGAGSFFAQELKKEAYSIGRRPAARCNIDNRISRAALLKAGFRICGYMLMGEIERRISAL